MNKLNYCPRCKIELKLDPLGFLTCNKCKLSFLFIKGILEHVAINNGFNCFYCNYPLTKNFRGDYYCDFCGETYLKYINQQNVYLQQEKKEEFDES